MTHKQSLLCIILLLTVRQIWPAAPVFYIEGNTGSGKTTLLKALCTHNPEFITLQEPVDLVQNSQGINALEMMYQDQPRWSLSTNLLFLGYHVEQLQETIAHNPCRIIVCDRSLLSGYAFCTADRAAGVIHQLEEIVYKKMAAIAYQTAPKPAGIIYVRTDPEVSYARIKKRNRPEEEPVAESYWAMLHEAHDDIFIHKSFSEITDIPVLIIDANEDMAQNPNYLQNCIQQIDYFIQCCLQRKIQ